MDETAGGAGSRGQVALVTGGGRGLGRAMARALAAGSGGGRRRPHPRAARGDRGACRRRRWPGPLRWVADVARACGAAGPAVAEAERRLLAVHLLVNNAGVAEPVGLTWESTRRRGGARWRSTCGGPLLFARAVLPGMVARGRGRIVRVASGAGLGAGRHFSAYATSKAVLIRLSEALAVEGGDAGVRVFAVSPGLVRTAMVTEVLELAGVVAVVAQRPRPGVAEGRDVPPERAAALVARLASGAAAWPLRMLPDRAGRPAGPHRPRGGDPPRRPAPDGAGHLAPANAVSGARPSPAWARSRSTPAPVHPHLFRHARVRQIVRQTKSLPHAQKQTGGAGSSWPTSPWGMRRRGS